METKNLSTQITGNDLLAVQTFFAYECKNLAHMLRCSVPQVVEWERLADDAVPGLESSVLSEQIALVGSLFDDPSSIIVKSADYQEVGNYQFYSTVRRAVCDALDDPSSQLASSLGDGLHSGFELFGSYIDEIGSHDDSAPSDRKRLMLDDIRRAVNDDLVHMMHWVKGREPGYPKRLGCLFVRVL